ncbi:MULTISPECIES: DUF1343 domain-containing protein [unclassified Arcicella]|uniref:exo-beta-N-acetylmuramidase NamZ family protein n=1 Tax=unclassified Arcicella TaxID=2644986 RepID=UPI00285739A5|nr:MULTISPECIES: DUF1343 domain-containing protein [unclassified Arcicella]MDR6563214.1 uncharacterized protein YbbC (DUF1343 family) [Arcicella sp. BE51]MDR6811635.1 uncharacterized protein YbbC (DUF1343 family) [Arcicella sp. BE140]MDR6823161.1 uncharacterized protein YbbC (DUF1343 family) [Arcicella sp. BE139]
MLHSTKIVFILTGLLLISCVSSKKNTIATLQTGAEQTQIYLPLLKGKTVALVVNHTSVIGKTHLADSLISLGVKIKTIFAPEHGFRGTADAGEHIANGIDKKTGLPIVSLYGANKKPSPTQLEGIDVVIFDIQDVGARFYTYTSTMHYVMEACAETGKAVLVLDRPNPNGHYVDGPVLDKKFASFVGLNPIPVVHGCTVGELAQMINQEGWLKDGVKANLTVVKCLNYQHSMVYAPPIAPSPNLPNLQSILLYPSICFFEGTDVSVGRGTDKQFQVIGSPNQANRTFTFTPEDKPGAKNPPQKGKLCYGLDLSQIDASKQGFTLKYVLDFYQQSVDKNKFFSNNAFFNLLAGSDVLKKQIIEGKTEAEIRASWKKDLDQYKAIRKKYLLYAE